MSLKYDSILWTVTKHVIIAHSVMIFNSGIQSCSWMVSNQHSRGKDVEKSNSYLVEDSILVFLLRF